MSSKNEIKVKAIDLKAKQELVYFSSEVVPPFSGRTVEFSGTIESVEDLDKFFIVVKLEMGRVLHLRKTQTRKILIDEEKIHMVSHIGTALRYKGVSLE